MPPTYQVPNMPPVPPVPPARSRMSLYLWIAAVAVVCAVGVLVFQLRTTGANADYICTKTISVTGACANGAWSAWQTVSQTTEGNVTTSTLERTYTGTRSTSKTLQYLNLRTACQSGYEQQAYGSGGGASGFHSGSVTTTESACQIVQTQTFTRTTGATGSSFKSTVSNVQTDIGAQTSNKQDVGSLGELNALDTNTGGDAVYSGDASGEIKVQPNLVRSGDPTVVTWTTAGISSCTVTSDGGDSWSGTSGTKNSKPILQRTIFTLTCPLDALTSLTATAQVDVAPVFQEN